MSILPSSLESLVPALDRMCSGYVPYDHNKYVVYDNTPTIGGDLQYILTEEFFPIHMRLKDCDRFLHNVRTIEDKCTLWQKSALATKKVCLRIAEPASAIFNVARSNITTLGQCIQSQKNDICEYVWAQWNICTQNELQ